MSHFITSTGYGTRSVPTTFKRSFLNERHLHDFRGVQFPSDVNFNGFRSPWRDRRKTDRTFQTWRRGTTRHLTNWSFDSYRRDFVMQNCIFRRKNRILMEERLLFTHHVCSNAFHSYVQVQGIDG